MKRHYTTTVAECGHLAKEISEQLKGGEIFALSGPLGSGKTTFTQHLGKLLKVKHKITSPTFIIMNRYPAKLNNKPLWLYHLDLYRTQNFKEVAALGLQELWGRSDTVTIIEWADKIQRHLPRHVVHITFTPLA